MANKKFLFEKILFFIYCVFQCVICFFNFLFFCILDAYAVLYDRERHHSGSIEGQDISATAGRSATTTNAARYGQYRSRSELAGMGGTSPPRRYASQTLLDGARPGPTTGPTAATTAHSRRDALYELQRELDSLASRSPASGGDFVGTTRQQQILPGRWDTAVSSGSSIFASAAAQQQQQRNYEFGRKEFIFNFFVYLKFVFNIF